MTLLTHRMLLAAVLPLLFVACASPFRVDPHDPLKVSENVGVDRDPFKEIVHFQGPIVSNIADDGSDAPEVEDVSLRAQSIRGRPPRFFLTVSDTYSGDWRGYDQAFDLGGQKFHALSVRHKVNCPLVCGYEEVLEIELTRNYLDSHLKDGINMRLYGPSGGASAAFTVPGSYIEGFLKGAFVTP